MCGIIAGNINVNNKEIITSLDLMSHRGPDNKNYIKLDNIFLAHARLSIVDIVGGQQPLVNEDNSIFAIVNGEFYDYEEIRKDLINKGHILKTKSDSEILIHLYEEYGVNCLKYLHGEFAFILYDKRYNRWFCGRDRMGIRPLQYYFKDNVFIIGSEVKSILAFNKVKTEFDRESYWFSQHLQYLPLDKTLFKNINMIKPGHYLIIEGDSYPLQYEYWSLKSIKEIDNINFNEAKEKVIYLLEKSVKKRIPKEVKWATHLSGGIDSSIITSLAANYNNNVSSFTISFIDDDFYNEYEYAEETAKHLGVNLISIPLSFQDMIEAIPMSVYHAEGLSINGHIGAKYILNQEIRKNGFKVALSGEGSDEIFMGYSHLKQDYLTYNALNNMEKSYLKGFQLPDDNMLDLSILQEKNGFIPTWIKAKSSMAYKFRNLWHDNFKYDDIYEKIIPDLKNYSSNLKSSSGIWSQYCLSGYILKVLDDAQSMAHSIEGRLPFLDTELIEFMYSVPDNIYFYNDIEKGLLREGFKNKLPERIIKKTKQSFMSPPINRFLSNKQFQLLMEEYIYENKNFKNMELFDFSKLRLMLNNNKENSVEPILMTILCTGILLKKFF